MKEILILGSLPKNSLEKELYQSMVNICKNYSEKVLSPLDTSKFNGTDNERYKRALEKVRNANLIIGEQTKPSTGQGIEIGYAITLNKPLIIVAEQKSIVSGLVKGCPNVKTILYYTSINSLEKSLASSIEYLQHENIF